MKIDRIDKYDEGNFEVAIIGDSEIAVMKKYSDTWGAPNSQLMKFTFEEFQTLINIVNLHNQIRKRGK